MTYHEETGCHEEASCQNGSEIVLSLYRMLSVLLYYHTNTSFTQKYLLAPPEAAAVPPQTAASPHQTTALERPHAPPRLSPSGCRGGAGRFSSFSAGCNGEPDYVAAGECQLQR